MTMSIFEDQSILIKTQAVPEEGRGTFLKIVFEGIHTHHWPPGARVQEFVETEIRKVRPSACLFDFLGYEYTFGNEIGGPIMAAIVYGGAPPTPVAIVAQGLTARSLKSLFAFGNLDKITGFGFFEDIPKARAFLEQELERRRRPPSSTA